MEDGLDQGRLADAGIADQPDDLRLTALGARQGATQLRELGVPTHDHLASIPAGSTRSAVSTEAGGRHGVGG